MHYKCEICGSEMNPRVLGETVSFRMPLYEWDGGDIDKVYDQIENQHEIASRRVSATNENLFMVCTKCPYGVRVQNLIH